MIGTLRDVDVRSLTPRPPRHTGTGTTLLQIPGVFHVNS